MKEGDPASLLGPSEATPGVQFWTPDTRERQTYWRESSEESLGSLRGWSISPMRKYRDSWDCWAWRRKVSRRTFINVYKYLEWGGKEDRSRLFSVVTKENEHKLNTGGSLWTRGSIFSLWVWLSTGTSFKGAFGAFFLRDIQKTSGHGLGHCLYVAVLEAEGLYHGPSFLRYFGILSKERYWNQERVRGIHQTGNFVHLSTWTMGLLISRRELLIKRSF